MIVIFENSYIQDHLNLLRHLNIFRNFQLKFDGSMQALKHISNLDVAGFIMKIVFNLLLSNWTPCILLHCRNPCRILKYLCVCNLHHFWDINSLLGLLTNGCDRRNICVGTDIDHLSKMWAKTNSEMLHRVAK